MKPFVKWAGGKRQILNRIEGFIMDSLDGDKENHDYTYIEPFLGGGAVFFNLKPKKAIINDLNSDLINAYRVIKSEKYIELIEALKQYKKDYENDKDETYYATRALDRDKTWLSTRTDVEAAARMIFLNRTCYNGLYRVNSRGEFNTPIGRYKNPTICDEENIKEIHDYLSDPKNEIIIMNESYEEAIRKAKDGDVIYIDPPYDYEDDDGFTKYQMSGFTFDDFTSLKKECDCALNNGAFIILSNNATTKVLDLFKQDAKYKICYTDSIFPTLRNINCNGNSRRIGEEVIFWGMPSGIPFPQANDLYKVINLAMADDKIFTDKEYAMSIIDVTKERTLSYYMSALMYLGYITHDKNFTNRELELKKNKAELEKDVYNQLSNNKIFMEALKAYRNDVKPDKNVIAQLLMKENKAMSLATAIRRASTVANWAFWMRGYELDSQYQN